MLNISDRAQEWNKQLECGKGVFLKPSKDWSLVLLGGSGWLALVPFQVTVKQSLID